MKKGKFITFIVIGSILICLALVGFVRFIQISQSGEFQLQPNAISAMFLLLGVGLIFIIVALVNRKK